MWFLNGGNGMQAQAGQRRGLSDVLYSINQKNVKNGKTNVNHGNVTRIFFENGRMIVNYSDTTVACVGSRYASL